MAIIRSIEWLPYVEHSGYHTGYIVVIIQKYMVVIIRGIHWLCYGNMVVIKQAIWWLSCGNLCGYHTRDIYLLSYEEYGAYHKYDHIMYMKTIFVYLDTLRMVDNVCLMMAPDVGPSLLGLLYLDSACFV